MISSLNTLLISINTYSFNYNQYFSFKQMMNKLQVNGEISPVLTVKQFVVYLFERFAQSKLRKKKI
jgi:hypothetical protein